MMHFVPFPHSVVQWHDDGGKNEDDQKLQPPASPTAGVKNMIVLLRQRRPEGYAILLDHLSRCNLKIAFHSKIVK